MSRNVWFIYVYLDHMVGLSCQFEMYVNIMLGNKKMVQDGCIKSIRGAMIPLEGKRKGGLWDTKSFAAKCEP